MTGSAIAIPLLGAGAANAADGVNWDRIAECESGGAWSENSGNGFYGGLQLTQEDWEKYGGLDHATSPDQASRGQQISVAEKILADQGVGAWRTCGLLAGLGQDAPAADAGKAGSGATGSSASQGSGDTSASPAPSATPDPSSSLEDKGDEPVGSGNSANPDAGSSEAADAGAGSDSSASPSVPAESATGESDTAGRAGGSSTATDAEGAGRHRGASAEEAQGSVSESPGRHASGGLNAWGGTVADYPAASVEDVSLSVPESDVVGFGVGVLPAMGGQLIGGGPDLVLAGQ
ncbi:transglycosylase family protein [Streptomyces sp. NPDC086080]|uniref:transglycosylase family protein n=1 Tax=Streptomyces sp. NPDC086080 TaxID=3365748 RepID=UPI0037CD03E5